jgi:hypothetical protein
MAFRELIAAMTALSVVTIAACSLFNDTSGFAGETTPEDAEAPLADANLGDAKRDILSDATDATDSARDASNVEARAPFACMGATICLDFDDLATVSYKAVQNGPITINADDAKPYEGQKSLHVKKTLPGTVQAVITIDTTFAVTHCNFMIWIEHSGIGFIEFFNNYREPTADAGYKGYNALSLAHGSTSSYLGEYLFGSGGRGDDARVTALDQATGRWVFVDAKLEPDEGRVAVDDSITTKPLKLKPAEGPTRTVLLFGANYASDANDTWEFFIDNIRCTL